VKVQTEWGIAGERRDAHRVVEVGMGDDMRFRPARIEVHEGETLRFVLRNHGAVMHEFVLGTTSELEAHAARMKAMPEMEHDAPYMAHVAPGKAGEIVWAFNRPGRFRFACLIPGHYDAGMVGEVVVTAAPQRR
jgi:uncharacterized cupredoxin-like copper-binding protein